MNPNLNLFMPEEFSLMKHQLQSVASLVAGMDLPWFGEQLRASPLLAVAEDDKNLGPAVSEYRRLVRIWAAACAFQKELHASLKVSDICPAFAGKPLSNEQLRAAMESARQIHHGGHGEHGEGI